VLRTLDAIHLATAVLVDADLVLAYDERLTHACRHNGMNVAAPGRKIDAQFSKPTALG
jgi:hypothetical protein